MIKELVSNQKDFFSKGNTRPVNYRIRLLKRLKQELVKQEQTIIEALYSDFKKPPFESMLSETKLVLAELDLTIKKLDAWSKPQRVRSSILNFPSSDTIYYEPYGTVLVIAPWNYPYQLSLLPVIGAIAAGNTVVLKPSELAKHTAQIIETILQTVFKETHVAVVQGDATIAQKLLEQHWDYIFFTGSVVVGKLVAQAAAKHLTPTTLELGGKNPCIVDKRVDVKLAAKRIVWGKFLNAGQTCIAPDYLIVHTNIKQALIKCIENELELTYSNSPKTSKDFARIINPRNYKRLVNMIKNEAILIGGETIEDDLFMAPTIIDEPSLDSDVMQDEIFGPILPLLTFTNEQDLKIIIQRYPKPLSLYVFSSNRKFAKKIIADFSFGGGAINDTLIQFANHRLPFGGVGNSGLGAYHGAHTFNTFSHKKAVVRRGTWIDIPLRYAPYTQKKIKLLKFFFKYF